MSRKVLSVIYWPYKWLVFAPVLGISGMIFSIVAITLAVLVSPKWGSIAGGYSWARISSFFAPMTVSVSGKQNIRKGQSYVIVSNHQSHFDIFVVYGWLGLDVKWVMKKELRKTPFIGLACEKVGHIYIDRSDSQKAIESLETAKNRIVNGASVMFFPEGTRTKDGNLGRFKKGAFRMALDLQLPILPITINGTRKILPTNSFDLLPGRAKLTIHPEIDTSGYAEANVMDLISKTRSVIENGLTSK